MRARSGPLTRFSSDTLASGRATISEMTVANVRPRLPAMTVGSFSAPYVRERSMVSRETVTFTTTSNYMYACILDQQPGLDRCVKSGGGAGGRRLCTHLGGLAVPNTFKVDAPLSLDR